jgi:DNA-directed RNA polymerase subunit RPC12/RpoP
MTYTYTYANCGEIVEITCSIAEKEEREKELVCPSCGGKVEEGSKGSQALSYLRQGL